MKLPKEVLNILKQLNKEGFEAYIVGGCVRDLLMGNTPKDWDVTTNAKPENIQKIFPESFYENNFGTVTLKESGVEITPFRTEAKYTDKRHPDTVNFVDNLEEDLSRRDFTINAMAIGLKSQITSAESQTRPTKLSEQTNPNPQNTKYETLGTKYFLVDLFDGQKDLKNKIIRTVGRAEDRFGEDSLRLLRAVRFATVLDFSIEKSSLRAIKEKSEWLRTIAKERIRDEFIKIIESDNAYNGILLLESSGLLKYVIPELLEGVGVGQNLHHIYTVWEHNTRALKYASEKKYSLEVRLGALFHDIGKPRSKRGEGKYSTFYGHDVIGGRMTAKIVDRLKFSKATAEKIIKLVTYHMFYYNVDEVTESSVRRLLVNVGPENIEDLIRVREADRIGSGRPKAVPYKLRHLKYIIDKVSSDPISVKMLKINGKDIIKELDIEPGPKVGLMLNSLLAEVIDDPLKNRKETLTNLLHELNKKSPEELRKSLEKIENAQESEEKERMKKYYV